MNETLIPLGRNYKINILNNEFSHHIKLLGAIIQQERHIPESMNEDRILHMVMILLNQNISYSSC